MNQDKILKIFGLAMFVIISLACPIIYVENTAISILFSQNTTISALFYILVISAIFLISASLVLLFFKKDLLGFCFSLIGLIIIVFLKYFVPEIVIGPGQIFLIVIAFIIVAYSYSTAIEKLTLSINDIVEIGVLVALAIVFDLFIKIRIGANGGSISLVMLPLFIICLRKGFFKGFLACGLVFGLINCLMDGYGFATYQFDYLFGFGSLAILGIFRKLILNKEHRLKIKGTVFIILGVVLSLIFRTIFSTISGVIIYEYTFVASLVYNVSYIGPSGLCVLIALIILYKPLLMIDKKYPNS